MCVENSRIANFQTTVTGNLYKNKRILMTTPSKRQQKKSEEN
jgi:hypothetical protein